MALIPHFLVIRQRNGRHEMAEVPGDTAVPVWKLLHDPRFRTIPVDPGYLDAYAVLSPDEARSIWTKPMNIAPERVADDPFSGCDVVVVRLEEWSSGM